MKKSIEKKLAEIFLKSIKNEESLRAVESKYGDYSLYVLGLNKYKFNHLPESFSKLKDMYVKYRKEVKNEKNI